MAKKVKDRVEVLEKENSKLKKVIREKDKTIKQLKSESKTAEDSFRITESYLKEITKGKPLSEILDIVGKNLPLQDIDYPCPKCNSRDMKKILFTGFYIVSCECGYRKRVDEEQQI